MLGVKDYGRAPRAWSIRPVFRGDLVLCDEICELLRLEAFFAYGPGKNLQSGAQNRVLRAVEPALSEYAGKDDQAAGRSAKRLPILLLETILAKEAKTLEHFAVENT